MVKRYQAVFLSLACMLFADVYQCARGDDEVVQKTAVVGLGSRDVVMSAFTSSIPSTIEYQLKCVLPGDGCDADAAGTPVSGVFNKGKNQVTGVVQGLEPDTAYDCYVIARQEQCSEPLSVRTEPILYAASWGSLGNDTPSGDILACDIGYSVVNSQSNIGPCYPTPSIINGNNSYPYSTHVQGSKAFSVYYYRPETTGVLVYDISENGTTLATSTDAYGPVNAGPDDAYVADIAMEGDNVYIGLENGEILLCSVLSNGTFTDCNSTGPLFKGLLSLYRNNDLLYVIGVNITVCSITNNGSLVDCTRAYSPGSSEPWGMAITGEYAYITITNGTNPGILLCTVNSDGTLSDCSLTGSGIKDPTGIVLVGNQAYISRYGSVSLNDETYAQAYTCKILPNGELSNCSGEIVYAPSSGILDISV